MSGCEPLFWKKPDVLLKNTNINFFTGCTETRYNAFFRVVLLILIVGLLIDTLAGDFSGDYLMENTIGIVAIVLAMFLVYWFFVARGSVVEAAEGFADAQSKTASNKAEGFMAPINSDPIPKALTGDPAAPVQISSPGHVTTWPAPNNPYMNVLVHEVKYNPTRAGAADVDCPAVKETLENYYRVQWWADPTDVYGKSQDQRMFYTMPSTSIPNDQASFQDWLFKIPGKTCKEGNRDACTPGTNGGAIPWLSQPN